MSGTGTHPDRLSEQDLYLLNEGRHFDLHRKLGAHLAGGGAAFAVWAPNAERVSVIGDFNDWTPGRHELRARGSSGVWEGFVPGVEKGSLYKYRIVGKGGVQSTKADPVGFLCEIAPKTASVVWDLDYEWGDGAWMKDRGPRNALDAPMSIYEVHLGSWMPFGTYREIAPRLADHAVDMGFTHVELLPVMEHPFYGSWGYQTTGYFAPSSRFGTPQDFMYLVDVLHQRGLGVILDWVPSHFPNDPHGPGFFDGTHLYEHEDPKRGVHADWDSLIFNYGRHEVRSFLISSALFWLEMYHADGIRVDAVASMLYRDYSRAEGEWIPNEHGGREDLEAIEFLRALNTEVYRRFPDVQTIAEESTSWPMVSRPVSIGGLGFGLKWDMGWMHDSLRYFSHDPVHRKFHHNDLTFRMLYAFNENFVLPLSHDEVVHGKGSLLSRMPGDEWRQFANLRLLFASLYAQPGKKLLFQGNELAPRSEWSHEAAPEWSLRDQPLHGGITSLVRDLNRLHRDEPALHRRDTSWEGFEWVDVSDVEQSVFSFLRHDGSGDAVLVVLNATPIPRHDYRIGVPDTGLWKEILNTDAKTYGGSGLGNLGGVEAESVPHHGRDQSVKLTLPPLSAIYLRRG